MGFILQHARCRRVREAIVTINPATPTPAPTTSEPLLSWRESELAHYPETDVLEAGKHTWSMSDRLDPHTFQLLANYAADSDET